MNQFRKTLFLSFFFAFNCYYISYAQEPKLPTQWTKAAMESSVPLDEYPRPQLQRDDWMCLNGQWDYLGGKSISNALNPEKPISFEGKFDEIRVPYCPESVLSGIQRNQEINMWYRRSFEIPVDWQSKQIILHFDAVDHDATIFVNGKKAGIHSGGYDAFSLNITPFIKKGINSLIVAAYDPNDGKAPSGKNGPRGDYTFSSGIWQTVWLEPVNETYIKNIRLLPDIENNRLKIFVNAESGRKLSVEALEDNKVISQVDAVSGAYFYFPIENPKLWSPDSPFLYNLKITLYKSDGSASDEVLSYFGMRDIKLGKVNGVIRPLLNGKFVMQLGLLDQGYWPDGILTAPTDEALKYDIQFTKNAGFNLIRKHMKTEPQRFYYWADKLGLMVWQDMPAIWYPDEDSIVTRKVFREELKAIIDDHYNSPSIITWVPFNENWGAFDVKSITEWTKQYDPSRLVNGNSGFNNNPPYQEPSGDPGNGDFVDTHIYIGPYGASEPDDHRAASLGEFGGVGLYVRGHMWPVENNAYGYEPTIAALTDRYILLFDQVEQLMKYKGLSVAIYTQTTDVEHEVNGLLTYDRAVEKIIVDKVKIINDAIIKESYKMNPMEHDQELVFVGFGTQKYPLQNADAPDYNIDKDSLAIKGYDLTEYFINNKASKGSVKYQYKYEGIKYFFLNEKNKSIFIEKPEIYLPQYGGYCADKMGAIFIGGTKPGKHDVNPENFMIIDSKLYLFSYGNALYLKLWRKNKNKNLEDANKTWKLISQQN